MAEFKLCFIAMGQGDCCIVQCPDKRIVVVDCGRTSNRYGNLNYLTEGKALLREFAAENKNRVDALILTHSDADHHNLVSEFFSESVIFSSVTYPSSGNTATNVKFGKLGIQEIYISNAAANDSVLGNYTGGNLNNYIYANFFSTSAVYEVTINNPDDSKNSMSVWKNSDNFRNKQEIKSIAGKKLTVLNGKTDNKSWSVSLIAGNVPRYYDGVADFATEDNAKSLITLIELDGKKVLLTGDATTSTEEFLLKCNSPQIQNMELIQVPHHGSEFASTKKFVNSVNPKSAVVSVGFLEHSYKLPKYKVLERWLKKVEQKGFNLAYHDIDYWTSKIEKKGKEVDATLKDLNAIKDSWDKNHKLYDLNGSGTFFYLERPESGVYALSSLGSIAMVLFRETVNSNLTMTSQKTQFYKLSETGISYGF
ncbi:ComEC/Rec2 family competence protein [Paenibacillus caui]|uniref:ComEC/Rec2 family competence protein n=1 Tax=Paenibacillus caui TaxID=2873927 RepID=UPI001CA94C13|nr:MBL fold metallo-hydrolase [Paenibacillus caui]